MQAAHGVPRGQNGKSDHPSHHGHHGQRRRSPRALPPAIEFLLHGEHIALDNLLKLTGLAPSGGAAKALAAAGAVRVDGQVELRKTCKIRVGQLVQLAEARIRVVAAQ